MTSAVVPGGGGGRMASALRRPPRPRATRARPAVDARARPVAAPFGVVGCASCARLTDRFFTDAIIFEYDSCVPSKFHCRRHPRVDVTLVGADDSSTRALTVCTRLTSG